MFLVYKNLLCFTKHNNARNCDMYDFILLIENYNNMFYKYISANKILVVN